MEINADFAVRAAVHSATLPWVSSPVAGVDRRMLDRIGGEVARATSLVRYAPNSAFSSHIHGGGEEFLVLEGVFSDEHGDFPVGSYIRNPPTTSHTPRSLSGCVIFVKLWQFDPADRRQVRVSTAQCSFSDFGDRTGVRVLPLFADDHEHVRLETWNPETDILWENKSGIEVLLLEGSFTEHDETFSPQSWLRLPPGQPLRARSGSDGAKIWIKTGHLQSPRGVPHLSISSPASSTSR